MDTDLAARLRQEYADKPLLESEISNDPVEVLRTWIDVAADSGIAEPHAAALATSDIHGRPSVRMVLLKSIDANGAIFATNYESRKGQDLADNPHAAFTMWWQPLFRQVRVEGFVHRLNDTDNDVIFAERPRGAQIGAIASLQSHGIANREALENQVRRVENLVGDAPVARPHHWGGYRISFERIEFWQGRANRLHDRLVFELHDDEWKLLRLQP